MIFIICTYNATKHLFVNSLFSSGNASIFRALLAHFLGWQIHIYEPNSPSDIASSCFLTALLLERRVRMMMLWRSSFESLYSLKLMEFIKLER